MAFQMTKPCTPLMVSMGFEKELMALNMKVTTVKTRPSMMKKIEVTKDPNRSIESRGLSMSGFGKCETNLLLLSKGPFKP